MPVRHGRAPLRGAVHIGEVGDRFVISAITGSARQAHPHRDGGDAFTVNAMSYDEGCLIVGQFRDAIERRPHKSLVFPINRHKAFEITLLLPLETFSTVDSQPSGSVG